MYIKLPHRNEKIDWLENKEKPSFAKDKFFDFNNFSCFYDEVANFTNLLSFDHFDVKRQRKLATDDSNYAISWILSQK